MRHPANTILYFTVRETRVPFSPRMSTGPRKRPLTAFSALVASEEVRFAPPRTPVTSYDAVGRAPCVRVAALISAASALSHAAGAADQRCSSGACCVAPLCSRRGRFDVSDRFIRLIEGVREGCSPSRPDSYTVPAYHTCAHSAAAHGSRGTWSTGRTVACTSREAGGIGGDRIGGAGCAGARAAGRAVCRT